MGLQVVGDSYQKPLPLISPNSNVGCVVGCLNVRGITPNHNFVYKLLSDLNILATSEHWLHDYDPHVYQLQVLHSVCSASSPPIEDPIMCTPIISEAGEELQYSGGNHYVALS